VSCTHFLRFPVLFLLAAVWTACTGTRRNYDVCNNEPCQAGYFCNEQRRCVPMDGGVPTLVDGDANSMGRPDAPASDAAGVKLDARACQMDQECPQEAPTCLAGRCARCATAMDCSARASTPACNTETGKCVGCATDGTCAASTPICDRSKFECVTCSARAQCEARDRTLPVCHTSGRCVQCATASECSGATPACSASLGKCVACVADADCKTAGAPICDTAKNECAPCASDAQCEAKSGGAQRGCSAGKCVECRTSDHCKDSSKPICSDANACVPCSADSQCSAKTSLGPNPGVCLNHLEGSGRCATDTETIYVANRNGCVMSGPSAGSSATPLCHPQPAVDLAQGSSARRVVVLRGPALDRFTASVPNGQLSIIGQMGASINGGGQPGIKLVSGDLYVRGVTVARGSDIGIVVEAPGNLRLTRSVVEGNGRGGIYVDGGGFDISNTVVAGNGPGEAAGGLPWGGIRIQAVPTGGRTARIRSTTIVNNSIMGLSCASGISASGNLIWSATAGSSTASCAAIECCTGDPMISTSYRLQSGSPCIDRVEPNMSVADDIDGEARPKGTKSDCGADEF
jgi:hypothetical protein